MPNKFNLIYWKSEQFWLGKLMEHPEIITLGETLEELEANIRDAYQMIVFDDLPPQYQIKAFVCSVANLVVDCSNTIAYCIAMAADTIFTLI